MSANATSFKEGQIWARLRARGPAIDEAEKREGVDPDPLAQLERLRAILAFVGKRLNVLDPELAVMTVDAALVEAIIELKNVLDP